MPIQHIAAALLVVLVWGINFIFAKLALEEIPPLLLCGVRFVLASIPAIFFIKPPAMPYKTIILYGLIMFALQFSLVFMGMYVGMTPGMAALIMQVQVFFSMFFAAMLLGEIPYSWQIIGALVSFSGIAVVAFHLDHNISLPGFLLILGAAASWGIGNLITKKSSHVNMMALVVWGSFAACLPMLLLSFIFDGPQRIIETYHHITWVGVSSTLYITYISTWVGYGVWNSLIGRYSVSTVVPFALLVPIVGMLSSVLFLGEPFYFWKLVASLLVMGGLCINLLGARFFIKKIM